MINTGLFLAYSARQAKFLLADFVQKICLLVILCQKARCLVVVRVTGFIEKV